MKGEKTPNINHIEHLSRHEGERLAFDRLHTNHATAQPLNDAAADDATSRKYTSAVSTCWADAPSTAATKRSRRSKRFIV